MHAGPAPRQIQVSKLAADDGGGDDPTAMALIPISAIVGANVLTMAVSQLICPPRTGAARRLALTHVAWNTVDMLSSAASAAE
jgi:hypothetical protein